MSTVVSATFFRSHGPREDFIARAYGLLAQAHDHLRAGDILLAVDYGYQAALRTAGARLVGSKPGRLGAWQRLARIDAAGAQRAAQFQVWSPVRARAVAGLDIGLTPAKVHLFLDEVVSFIEEVEGGLLQVA